MNSIDCDKISNQISHLHTNLHHLLNDSQSIHDISFQNVPQHNITKCLQLSQKLIIKQQSTQKIIINTYQSITHLLDNLLILEGIIKSNDKSLLEKALEHFHDHLVSLVHNIHQYPVFESNKAKKKNFMQRHLQIINDFRFNKIKQDQNSQQLSSKDQFYSYNKSQSQRFYQSKNKNKHNNNYHNNYQIRQELDEAKHIIQELNRHYQSEIINCKQANINLQKQFQRQKHKFINIIEELEVETVRLRYEKLRDEMAIDQLKGELKQIKCFKNHQRQLSTGEFGLGQ